MDICCPSDLCSREISRACRCEGPRDSANRGTESVWLSAMFRVLRCHSIHEQCLYYHFSSVSFDVSGFVAYVFLLSAIHVQRYTCIRILSLALR